MDITPELKDDCISIERVETSHESSSSEMNVRGENDTKEKENRRKQQLINMKPTEKHQYAVKRETTPQKSSKKTTRPVKQSKPKKPAEVSKPQATAVKKSIESEDSRELLELKKVYEAHLKEKEEFEKLIEKRENEIDEQLREMDEVMESIYSEHTEIEKATGAFADVVKAHTNYKDEASRVRVQHIEQEISSDILFEENAELKEEIRELYDQINEIKERRAIGLQGLKQGTKEIKCAAEQLKGNNEEMEAETKKKMEEFNSLRMIMMDKGITRVNKGELVQGDSVTSFPRPTISKYPPLVSANNISTGLEIDIADIGNASLDIGKTQNDNTTESGRLSKWVSEKNLALDGNERRFTEIDAVKREECGEGFLSEGSQKRDHSTYVEVDVFKSLDAKIIDEKYGVGDVPVCAVKDERMSTDRCRSEVPERQLSAVEIVRLPDIHERKSRIPKPLVQFYGSASRDSERCKASEGSPLIMTESENSRRDVFVPEDQRHVTKPTMGYLDQETEPLRQQKSVVLEQREKMKENKIRRTDDKLSKMSVKKNEIAPSRCKKKEVKSKIDTGLKNRPHDAKAKRPGKITDPVGKMDKSVTRKVVKTEPAPKKYSNKGAIANVRKEQSCMKAKKQELPPLKNVSNITKTATNVPRSSPSFENKTPFANIKPANQRRNKAPLPSIKPANNQRKDLDKVSEKRVAKHHVLPPIKPSKMNHFTKPFTNKETDDIPAQISSNNQAPEAIRLSFSPVPPPNAAKSRKPSYRTQKLQSSRQDDKIRVLSERA